jgi:hypothetical protein
MMPVQNIDMQTLFLLTRVGLGGTLILLVLNMFNWQVQIWQR